jgi:hypothetical protein
MNFSCQAGRIATIHTSPTCNVSGKQCNVPEI